MDVLKYLNSRDVAEYLKSINFEFNAMQAAYVIYINEWLTMEERIRLWKEVIATMPDCEYRYLAEGLTCIMPSAHAAIREHVENTEELLTAFKTSEFDKDEIVFTPAAWWRSKSPDLGTAEVRAGELAEVGNVQWNNVPGRFIFKSFEKCIQRLKKMPFKDTSGSTESAKHYDRYQIRLSYLDSDYANCHSESHKSKLSDFLLSEVILNGNYEIIGFEVGWSTGYFESFVPEIPHPFEGGDIVIDSANAAALPFVFDRCVTWALEGGPHAYWEDIYDRDLDEEMETERRKPLTWRNVTIDEFSEAVKQRGGTFSDVLNYDHGHMFVSGYVIIVNDPVSVLEYWPFVCDNYLNLEYYRCPFEGRLSILPTVSWFVMNEDRESCDLGDDLKLGKARRKFMTREIELPNAAPYDICSLVNASFGLGRYA